MQTIQSKTRCGKCYHCLRPHFKQKCLEPIIKYSDGRVEQGGILLEGSQGEWVEVRPKEQPKAKTDDSRAVEPAAKGENPGGQEAPGNPQAPPTSAGVHECPSQGPGTAAQPSSGQLSKPPRPEDASGILTVKRGPGRPRKSAVLENSATPAVKRGPGRPKKNPESPTPARVGEAHVSSVVSSFQKAREAMTGPQEVVDGLLAPAAVAAVAVSLFQMPSTPPTLQKPAAPLAPQLAFDPTAADGHLSTATLPQARVWSESNLSAESDMEGALVEPKSEQAGSNLLSSARGCGQELPAAEVEALGGAAELPNDQPTESTVAAERDGGASDEAPIEMQATLEAGKERPGKGENLAAEFPGAQQHVDPPEAPVVSSATPEGDQLKGEDDERNTLKSSVAMVEKQLGGQTPVRGDGEPQGDAAGPADAQVTPAAQVSCW